jgi:hypothetical protein
LLGKGPTQLQLKCLLLGNRVYSCFVFSVMVTTSDRDKTYVTCFRALVAFSPTARTELAKEDCDIENVASLLDSARGDTRRSHASSVKKAIGDWHTFNPGYSKKPGSCWGWDHDECARLLCPPDIEWNEA